MRRLLQMTAVVTALAAAIPAAASEPADVPLVDQSGTPFTLRALRGAPVAVTFVASRCTDTCPIANGLFASVVRDLGRRRGAPRLVSVTIDPAYDTPIVMAALARRFDAQPARWRLASGSPHAIDALAQAFGVLHEGTEVHGTFIYVLDRDGRLARTLPLSSNGPAQLEAALAALR